MSILRWVLVSKQDFTAAFHWCCYNINEYDESAKGWDFKYIDSRNDNSMFMIYDDELEVLFRLKFQINE